MGFRFESQDRKTKTGGPRKASGFGMVMIFVVLAVSIVLGGWLPLNVPLRNYVPIPDNWYVRIWPMVPLLPIQLAVGVIVFILLQFVVVLISGILFPLPPEELYDKDGLYVGKNKR